MYENTHERQYVRKANDEFSKKTRKWSKTDLERFQAVSTKRSYGYRWSADEDQLDILDNQTSVSITEPRLFLASKAVLGIAPPETEVGDLVCTFYGCDVAVILRTVGVIVSRSWDGRLFTKRRWTRRQKRMLTMRWGLT